MGAVTHFPVEPRDESADDPNAAAVDGGSFGKPDGTTHYLAVLRDKGQVIVRLKLAPEDREVDLLLDPVQAGRLADGISGAAGRVGEQPKG